MAQFDPKKTALLLLDLQGGFLFRLPGETATAVVDNAASAIATARKAGATIAYVRAALTADEIAAVPDHSIAFAPMKASPEFAAAMHPDAPTTQFHEKLAPQAGDLQHRKTRFGTFMISPSKALLDDFAAKGIDSVIISGVVTSGAVLSAVRQLADLDFKLAVIEDACADFDPEAHKALVEKVFPAQATVVKASELSTLF